MLQIEGNADMNPLRKRMKSAAGIDNADMSQMHPSFQKWKMQLGSPNFHPKDIIPLVSPITRGDTLHDTTPRGLKRKVGCIEDVTQTGRKHKIDCEYNVGSQLGRGKYGIVKICKNKVTGEEFACKTLCKTSAQNAHKEVEIMQHLSGHPNVVTLRAVYEDADSIHLVMDFCSGGRLVDYMKKKRCFSEQRAAKLIKELVAVIQYCHEMGVVHRDIKPENILLTSDGQVKLADFGLSVHVTNGQNLSGAVGSPAYVAPEVLEGSYTEKVDVWGAGILLHALLIGVLPFRGKSVETTFEEVKTVQLNFQTEKWESVSEPAKDLLSKMLSRDVEKRLSPQEVLKHPWIMFYTKSDMELFMPASLYPYKEERNVNTKGKMEFECICLSVERSSSLVDVVDRALSSFSEKQDPRIKEEGNCDLMDVLSSAVSQMRISKLAKKSNRVYPLPYSFPHRCRPHSQFAIITPLPSSC